jgi:ribosomal protein L25 (general stress protein Ctc)
MKKTTFRIEVREAIGNNAARVLNIDGDVPGRIYACIDEETQGEITEQLAKRADTSDVIAADARLP